MSDSQAIKKIIITALLVKIIYFIVAFVSANFTEVDFKEREEFRSDAPQVSKWIGILCRNDANWYSIIARNGQQKITPQELPNEGNHWKQSYYAFFPAYPYTIRGYMALVGDFSKESFITGAFIFSIIFSIGCFVCFYFFAKDYFQNTETAFTAAFLLIIFPFHYYYSMYYTEALFLMLTLGCFLAINKEKYIILYVLSILLVLTRPNGFLMAVPLVFWILRKNEWQFVKKNMILIGVLCFVMGLTLLSYCIYLKYMTGDYFAFSTAQQGWGRRLTNPFSTLYHVYAAKDIFNSLYTILFIIITLVSIRKNNLSFLVIILIGLFMPISYGSVLSMPRFIILLFPFMLFFAQYMQPLSGLKKNMIYGVLFLFHIVTFLTWLFEMEFSF